MVQYLDKVTHFDSCDFGVPTSVTHQQFSNHTQIYTVPATSVVKILVIFFLLYTFPVM